MPRSAPIASIDDIIRSAVAPIVTRISEAVARSVAQMVAAELERELKGSVPRPGPRRGRAAARRRTSSEMTRWVADRRARRVPTFVIEATRLDTKKKIVARFGENAAFEKGKPLPTPKAAAGATAAPEKEAPRIVKAKPPIIRRAAGAK